MIQPSDNRLQIRDLRSIKETGTTVTSEDEILNSKSKVEILNIYEEHLQVTSPTYSEEIKAVMKKEDIEQSNLHAEIVKTMTKSGINVTKNDLNIIVNQLQEEHLFKLFEEGYEIEILTVDIIAKEIIKNEIIQNEMRPKAEDEEEKSNENKDIAKILVEAGLPVTNKNIRILEQYQDKIKEIADNSDIAISNMIRHKSEITINNLYTAKHRGAPKDTENPPTEEQIIAVLNMNGIKATQDNIKAASNLVKDHVEITKDNVKDFVDIKELISKIDSNELIKKAAKEMKKGINPGDINISPKASNQTTNLDYNEVSQLVKDIIEDLPRIDETVIEDTYRKDKPITIENLQKILHENVAKIINGKNNKLEIDSEAKVQVNPKKVSTTKRQLEEIRLSLTLEAALKLNNKLDIQTTELTKVVEELKVIEKENNEEILRNTGTPVTEENVASMKQTRDRIYNISQNKELAMAQVVEDKVDFTLEGMDQAIKLKHAQNTYEETGTKPERRFGEGIARVEEQLEHVLEMNEIEPTDSNIKAAKALVQNNIDISPEAIEAAKIVLLKIETVVHELRPAVVAKILKEGIRPDAMLVDDLIKHIREMQKDSQIDSTKKVAEGILELDQTNQLSPTEREGLVAVYRMLSTITKNETAAAGFLLDKDREPTLGNLFEASKYIKQVGSKTGKMDISVDDNLGMREGELPANIRSLIEEATKAGIELQKTDQDLELNIKVTEILTQNNIEVTPEAIESAKVALHKLETVLSEISPAVLAPMLKEGTLPREMDIDSLIERVQQLQKDAPLDSNIDQNLELTQEREKLVETYRMISTIAKNEIAAVGFLLDSEQEPTLVNLFEASINQKGQMREHTANTEIQIENTLEINKIEPTEINRKATEILIRNNIEVTLETVETAKTALLKIETILFELSPAVLAPILKEGIRPSEMDIDNLIRRGREMQQEMPTELNPQEREALVETNRMLSTITKNETAAIGFLLANKKEPTLENVFEASMKQEGQISAPVANEEKQIEYILKANQIEPTELNKKAAKVLTQNNKLINTETIEIAKIALLKIETVLSELSPAVLAPLLKEDIHLDKMPIDNLIERIRVMQKDTSVEPKQLVAKQGVEQILEQTLERVVGQTVEPNKPTELSPQEREQLVETYRMLSIIAENETAAIGALLDNNQEPTLEDIFRASTKQEASLSEPKVNEQKQIENILKLNQIEPTEFNKKAAQVLMQNNMPIHTESIEIAKPLLQKIETILSELTPAVLAPLLKEGLKPNKLSVDNLIDRIHGIQKAVEGTLPPNQTAELNPEERERLVETYRMLSTITKNETAATGVLLDNNQESTLGNLFEVAKLPIIPRNEAKQIHTENVIGQWLSRITPKELKNYIDMDKSLEEIELEDGKISSFEIERTTKQIKALEKTSPHTLKFLEEHSIPLTIPNIYWTDKMIKNPYLLGDMLKDYENLTGEKIESSLNQNSDKQNSHKQSTNHQNIEKILDQLEKELDEQRPKWLSVSQSTQAYSMGKEVEQLLNTQRQIQKNEGMYQIPIELHHGMSNLNVYVMKDKEQSNQAENNELRAYMSIKTKNIGVIQVNMRISDKAVAFEMLGETPEITLGLQKGSKALKVAIEEIGYNVMQAKFSPGKVGTSMLDKPKASTSLLKYRFEESKFEHII